MSLNTALAPAVAANDWVAIAAALGGEFKKTAAERERRNQLPIEELALFRQTGLVNLLIPEEFGGIGGDWKQTVRVIVELGKADPNIGLLAAYHYHNYQPPWLDYIGHAAAIQRRSAENRWLWGHVTQPFQRTLFAHPRADGGFVLKGYKPMNTGPATGDVMNVLVQRSDRDEFIYALIPTDRQGVIFDNDWDNAALRRTNTSGITFEDVEVLPDEVIPNAEGPLVRINPWYTTNAGISFGAAYLGAALGLLDAAAEYLDALRVPHPVRGGASSIAETPFILAEVGKLWGRAQAGLAYLDQVADEYDEAFERDPSPQNPALNRLHNENDAFRVNAARLGIDAGTKIYDILGPEALANSNGFDRYWRDVRVHSLHGSAPPYADRAIGDYFINGDPPAFSLFPPPASEDR